MKVNDPNPASLASAGVARNVETERTGGAGRAANPPQGKVAAPGDDVHLSELVRTLRSLAADSPDRQAQLEQIARAHATGSYKVDAEATASKIIEDALANSSKHR